MKRHELVIALVVGLMLGTAVTVALNGPSIFTLGRSAESVDGGAVTHTAEPLKESAVPPPTSSPTSPPPTSTSTSSPTETPPTATPTLMPLAVGSEKEEEDLEDVLLLYDATSVSDFDTNFCKIAEYYGLLCKKIALDARDLTDELLREPQGDYFKLVGIGADTLLQSPSLLTNGELSTIQAAIETGGVNLLVSKMNDDLDPTALVELTDGAVLGATKPQDSSRNWFVSSAAPEITREFTGQVISPTRTMSQESQDDFAIVLGQQDSVTTLITSTNDAGATYPIFVRWKKGSGTVFVDAGMKAESLEEHTLTDLYYYKHSFSKIVPLMFTTRYALGDEVWHNDHSYANLTIDDPPLWQVRNMYENWSFLDYIALLAEMEEHNFHTTIGFPPTKFWDTSEPEIVQLFLAYPDRFSLAQHGNNADGFEFYKYEASASDEYPARPLAEQEADIVEGLENMEAHRRLTGIPYDRIMIPPYGNMPEPTLVVLKKYNFLACVQNVWHPIDTPDPTRWDYGMYQANLDYGNFPLLWRKIIEDPAKYDSHYGHYPVYRLFLDKPVLLTSHARQMFSQGIDSFNPIADHIDTLWGSVEWHDLGYILKRLYLEKLNDDGSVDVKMYTNNLIVNNTSDEERTYHVAKEETLNVPILFLTVNGRESPYLVEDGFLRLNVRVPANSSMEVVIRYGE